MSSLPPLLFLTQRIPYPPDKGDKIRSFHVLKRLSGSFRVHLGCFFDDSFDLKNVPRLQEFCDSVFCLPLRKPFALGRGAFSLATTASLTEGYFQDRRMRMWVDDVVTREGPKHAFVYCSAMAPYLFPYFSRIRTVMDMVDVDSEKFRAYAIHANWPLRTLYAREATALLALERKAVGRFAASFLTTRAETDLFLSRAPECVGQVGHFSNGVDMAYFDPAMVMPSPFPAGAHAIVFTGAMDYPPNIGAVNWFTNQVFTQVRVTHPNAQFWIVGANPAPSVAALSEQAGVHVTGRVSDVRPYLSHAACMVAPLQIARGVQNKVLEALAMAKPIVVTQQAQEGLTSVPGRDLIQADTPATFAAAVSSVLDGQCEAIGRAGRLCIETDYSWNDVLRPLEAAFGLTPAVPVAEGPHVPRISRQ